MQIVAISVSASFMDYYAVNYSQMNYSGVRSFKLIRLTINFFHGTHLFHMNYSIIFN